MWARILGMLLIGLLIVVVLFTLLAWIRYPQGILRAYMQKAKSKRKGNQK